MDKGLRPLELTTPQYAVLSAIDLEPGISNAALARAAFVTAQTMQGIVSNLEREDLLRRKADPSHGRILRSELTKLEYRAAVGRILNGEPGGATRPGGLRITGKWIRFLG